MSSLIKNDNWENQGVEDDGCIVISDSETNRIIALVESPDDGDFVKQVEIAETISQLPVIMRTLQHIADGKVKDAKSLSKDLLDAIQKRASLFIDSEE